MSTLREAAQQALEALIAVTTRTCAGTDGMDITPINDAFDMADTAIAALRAALAQQAPHPDTIRLAYLYGGEKTASDALTNAQLRLFLGGALTLDEARAAIDDAIANPMMEDDHD
jgi:hypothetical protein